MSTMLLTLLVFPMLSVVRKTVLFFVFLFFSSPRKGRDRLEEEQCAPLYVIPSDDRGSGLWYGITNTLAGVSGGEQAGGGHDT